MEKNYFWHICRAIAPTHYTHFMRTWKTFFYLHKLKTELENVSFYQQIGLFENGI